ncbi:glutamate--tRNA ligase [Sphingobium lignivorans]|uniref:Glutamate--tRNA ligase n=1 Tax=Sphingobium lignivorans TaxID=2735886 RepID=A0ABR6NKC6_9SPHN|nr:glutamate--tRNA ligase [Sphingobium lignivorans]MBB5987737.1 glutamyl-tRNA synthetase [Sphingobium lignivorans]
MTVITRFAPSPTGKLHVGNIRAALHNWLWARKMGGKCLLRIDDTDTARSEERFVESIRADLAWLGLDMDGEVRQSARFALYEEKFQALRAAGRVYPCFETAQELEIRRKILLGRGLPPVYDRAALALTPEEIAAREAAGERPHWRFRLDHEAAIEWTDLVRGPQHFDPQLLSDPVIRRADGSWLYMLPSVIDDIDMGISHVLRGEDHVSNTATQIQMFAALGGETPQFAHMALLTGAEGKLSKRLGAIGVSDFRDAGIEPMAINALLARLGTSDPVEPVADMAPLIEHFDFARFGRAPARFSEEELSGLNTRIVHLLPYEAVADRLPAAVTPAVWPVIRPNLETLAQAADWLPVLEGDIAVAALGEEDRAFLAQAADMLAQADFSDDPWRALTGALKEATGRKGKALFLPLRLALTGMDHGPDMAALLPIIGKARALDRLRAAAAQVAAD